MLDEEDDQIDGPALAETLGENDSPSTEVSAQRRRAPLDFSHLIPDKEGGARKKPLDFSQFIPKVPSGEVPVPRPRPAEASASAPQPQFAPSLSEYGLTAEPTATPPAPPPPLNSAAPTEGGFPAPQPPEDVPLSRRHGYLGGGLFGDVGAATPEAAVAERAASIEAAQADSRRATEFRELQQQGAPRPWETPEQDQQQIEALIQQGIPRAQAEATVRRPGAPLPDPRQEGPAAPQGLDRTQAAIATEKAVEEAASATRQAPLPSRNYARALAENFANSLGTTAISTAAGVVRTGAYMGGFENKAHKLADWITSGNDALKEALPADIARPNDLGLEVAGGLGSSIPFMATGIASATLGLPESVAISLIASTGAFSQGEMSRQEAVEFLKRKDAELRTFYRLDDPTLQGPARKAAQEAFDRARNWTADDLKKLTVFVANGLMGTTEALPIADALHRINRLSGGGITRVAKAMGFNSLEEGLQEGAQQFVQNATEQLTFNPDKLVGDGVERAMIVAGLTGMLQGGAIQIGGEIRGKLTRKQVEARVPMPGEPAPLDLSEAPQPAVVPAAQAAPPSEAAAAAAAPRSEPSAAPAPVQSEEAPAPSAVSAVERRTLRKLGYSDEMIDGMNRAEIAAELGDAAEQGVKPEPEAPAEGQNTAPAEAETVPTNGVQATEQQQDVPTNGGQPLDFTHLLPDGSRTSPAKVTDASDIERAGAKVNTAPSEAQKEAGNYQKGHVRLDGFNISIENPAGSVRSGNDAEGNAWQAQLPVAYGYVKRTTGNDGDQVDAYVQGPGPIHIIDQIDPKTGKFDEHKLVFGPQSAEEAAALYRSAFNDGGTVNRIGAISAIEPKALKAWLRKKSAARRSFGKIAEPISTESADLNENMNPAAGAPTQQELHGETPPPAARYVRFFHGGTEPASGGGRWVTPSPDYARDFRSDGAPNEVHYIDIPENWHGLKKSFDDTGTDQKASYVSFELPERLAKKLKPYVVSETEQPASTETVDTTTDAKKAVDDALAAIGIPSEAVDQADVQAAAKLVAETGAEPGDAFQQVMEQQIEGAPDAADSAATVPVGVEAGTRSGEPAEGEQLLGSGETRAETSQGDQAAQVQPDRTGNAEEADNDRSGDTEKTAGAEDAGDVAKAASLSDTFAAHLREGGTFKNILAARKMAKEAGFDGDAKAVEEAMELAVVTLARQIVSDRSDPKANFTALVDLYSRQPKLGTRTSTSMRDQAFSTPVPLAYVASRLAEVTPETEVYEPTAGNGALLIEAAPDKVTANELNASRADNLNGQGFLVGREDASRKTEALPQFDRVLANPPFGAVRQEGQSQVFDLSDIQNGYKTKEIDHAIALRALERMLGHGRAVLLVGGLGKANNREQSRSDAYNGKAKREFYKTLYDRYNVTDHFTTSGDLWERQGAGWPVDVIVIDGRGKSARALPAVDVPRVLTSWDQLGGLIDAVPGRSENASDDAADRASERGAGGRDGGVRDDGVSERLPERGAEQGEPGEVQRGRVRRSRDDRAGEAGRDLQERAGRGLPERDAEPTAPGDAGPRGITAAEAVDAALADAFGPPAGPKSSQAPAKKSNGARTTAEVAKSAATNVVDSADAALSGLYELFGGGKTVGEGLNFDEATWAKAKPLFIASAEKFAEFKNDIGELAKRLVTHLRYVAKWPQEAIARMRPYLIRFIEDVQNGTILLTGETAKAAPKSTAATKEQETDRQVSYAPQSKSDGLGTLVPVNMRASISDALASIEKRVGPLDTYVAKELGYQTDAKGAPYFERNGEKVYPFAAEQIDAIALGIENIERGKGFIIGDQTGIGKGRVNAAMLRYAMEKGHIPILVTAKANLYGDMYRDLTDIGIQEMLGRDLRILATNSGESIPLTEGEKPVVLKTADSTAHKQLLNSINSENFKDKHDVVFTTYNQLQTVKSADTARRALLMRLARDAVISFDESHEAGGTGAKGKKEGASNRAEFTRELIDAAKGVFYSSATYAKRPDVMDLYSKTDMSLAVENKEDLGEAIARGGVPMQQVVAAMLAKAGQYIRRERSFAGVTYDTPLIPVDRELYDSVSHVLAGIQHFSGVVAAASTKLDQQIKAEAEARGYDNSTGEAGASSTLFTSIMHNVINQLLLALKAGPVAKMAIEALERGEKPVITLANTMESLLNDVAEHDGLRPGDVFNADFGAVLQKYLDRTRTLIIKKPFSKDKVVRHYMTDAELGPAGLARYDAVKAQIENIEGLDTLPASPIDRIKQDLANAGYKVGEITGRNTIIDYSGDEPVLQHRAGTEKSIRGRRDTISKFNSGALDALVLNQAGSTGLSLHASEKYKDQRQRHMMIAQPEGNIDTHMQMLGRVHRTGQVVVPKYSQLVADIPAEKRPAAVLAKKMASLNANTTASRGGALTAKDVPDFINEYGDMIAATIIADDSDLNQRLGNPVKIKDNGSIDTEDAMRRLTGRIPLMPLDQQEALYERLEADYKSLIDQMNAAGENALEASTLDLKARALERTQVVPAKSGLESPFAAPVSIEKTSILRQGKPFSAMELMDKLGTELGMAGNMADVVSKEEAVGTAADMLDNLQQDRDGWGARAYEKERSTREDALDEFSTYLRSVLDDIEDPAKQEKERTKLNAVKDRFSELHELMRVGARITLKTLSGNKTGIVIKTERTGQARNPLALSTWKATFAIADAERQVILPFSRLYLDGKGPADDKASIELRQIGWVETPAQTIERFTDQQHSAREERNIATGNLLAAYEWLNMKGRIVNYTDAQGHIRQGILTAKDFDLAKHYETRARPIRDPAEVVKWMRDHKGEQMWSEDNVVRLEMYYDKDLYITTEGKKSIGGVYYLDKELTGITNDFYKRGGTMVANVQGADTNKITRIVERLQQLGATFVDRSEAKVPPAEKIEQPEGPKEAQSVRRLTAQANTRQREMVVAVRNAINQVTGWDTAQRSEVVQRINKEPDAAWGATATEGNIVTGTYDFMRDLITVALANNSDAVHVAYHEGWHSIEELLTPAEKQTLSREAARLREFVARHGNNTRAELATIADSEVFAEAAAVYTRMRSRFEAPNGMHIAVRRMFEKVREIMARIRNALNGLGFTSSEDIFAKFAKGEMAQRKERAAVPARDEVAQSVRRRAAGPNDVVPAPETIRGAWNQDKSLKQRVSDVIDAMLLKPSRNVWDPHIDMLRFQKGAEAIGSAVPESMDAYLAASLYPGLVGEKMKDAARKLWEPVYDAMRDHKISRDDLQDYLYARHAPERNARIREIDPQNDSGSGMTDAEAAEIMGRVIDRTADFQAVARLIDGIVAHNRAVMARKGLESERALQAWADAYQHYVPLKGFEAGSDNELIPTPSTGRGFDTRGRESMQALGRFDRADDILANLLDQTMRTIVRGEKNEPAKAFLRFAQANPSPYYKIGLAEKKRRLNKETGLVEEYWSNLPTHLDRVFAAKVGGKTYFIEIKHEGLLTGLKSLGAGRMNLFVRMVARLTREYSRFQTAKNPEFVFTNLTKDLQDAGFRLSGEERDRLLVRYAANLAKGKALYASVLGVARNDGSPRVSKLAERLSGPDDAAMRRWFEEWRENGGKISHYGFMDIEQIGKAIEKELNSRTESTGKSVALFAPRLVDPLNGKVVKFLEALSDVTESTTRLAVYIAARETGLSRAQAALLSRNATVDFNKGGPTGQILNSFYAFSKANILGNVGLVRTLRKSKIARRAAMGIAVAGALMTYWNMAVSPEDEEKKRGYEKRKYWERERNIIIYIPGRVNAIKIPLGYGLNVFWMMGEQVMMRMLGKVSTSEAFMNVLGTTVSAFNPLGSEHSWLDWKSWVDTLSPTVIKFMPQLAMNRQWFGGTIHPDEMPWNKHLPHSDQHKINTHPYAVKAAEAINRMTGGNKSEPGALSPYPDSLEYSWNFAIGGLGRFLNNTAGTISDAVNGVDRPVERIPFVRRFVASDNSPAVQAETYYKRRTDEQAKAQRLRSAVKSRADGTDDGSADEVIARLARETGARPSANNRGITVPSESVFRSSDSQIKALRREEDGVRNDTKLTPAERKTRIDGLREQMRKVMGEARARLPATAP